jgi:ABC-type branched-subunit amino acid transport system ATPase component/ABC-type branched-subunit amino acid transport system permease subunit
MGLIQAAGRRGAGDLLRRHSAAKAVLIAICIALVAVLPVGISSSWNLELGFACIYGLIGLSLKLVVGSLDRVSLGQQALVGIGGFTAALIVAHLPIPFGLAVVAGGIAGALVASLIGGIALRLPRLHVALVTLVLALAAENWLFQEDWFSGGQLGATLYRNQWLADNYHMYLLLLACLLLAMLLDYRLGRNKFGRAVRAVRDAERVAEVYGIRPLSYGLSVFVVSGFLAGVAGALWAEWEQVISVSDFPYQLGLVLLMMVVIGGITNRLGVVVASGTFAIFSVVLGEIQPLVNLVGTTHLALFLPVLTGPLVTVVLIRAARKQERRDAGGRGRPAGGDLSPGNTGSVHALARLSPSVVTRDIWRSPAPIADSALVVENLSVTLGGLNVLRGISLTVQPGEVVGLVGPNGAGKTTCFNCISGYQRRWSGDITFGGHSLNKLPASSRGQLGIARTFQGGGLLRGASVKENLMISRHRALGYSAAGGVFGTPRSVRAEKALLGQCRELLARSGLERLENVPVGTLSYGTMRLVEIMCVFATDPKLLMLDEPSSGMSASEASLLGDWLAQVRTELDISLLIIEHHVPMVVGLCDRVYVLDAGTVIAADVPSNVRVDPAVVSAFLGEPVRGDT